MPDQRLLDLASRAGDAARPPDFRDLARRGDRLRRVRTTGVGMAVAALLATTVFGVQAVYDDQAGPVPPAQPTVEPLPSPPLTDNSATPLEDLTPKQIVYDEDARLETAIPVPSAGTGATAAIWSVCRKSDCARALALTTDGFETGTHVDLSQFSGAPILGDAGGGSILLADRAMAMDAPVIVSPDGSTRPLRRSTEPGPMLADEVLVDGGKWISYRQSFFKTMNPVAVNVQTATSHPISIPGQGTFVQLVQSGRSTLWGPSIAIEGGPLPQGEAIWSEDGGATWDSHPLPSDLVSDGE